LISSDIDAPPAKDRRVGLVLFGLLDLFAAVVFLIQAIAVAAISLSGATLSAVALLPGELLVMSLIALIPAIFFGALGIGSILGQRWARSLSLAFASLWLAFGAVTAVCILIFMPFLTMAGGEKAPLLVYLVVPVFMMVPPALYVLFYRSPAVAAHCEFLDPEERWTDRRSIAVLMAMILLVVAGGIDLRLGFSASRQILFFGGVLSSTLRNALLGYAALQVVLALELGRSKRSRSWAWIASVIVMALHLVLSVWIARGITVDRLAKLAARAGKGGNGRRVVWNALGAMNLSAAVTGWVAALGIVALVIVIRAGKGPAPDRSDRR
jgi:hypothetical protein